MDQQNTKKDNSGYLYPNVKKSEKQPDFRGKVTVGGKELLISGWKRLQSGGEEMITLAFTDPETLPKSGAPGGNSTSASTPKAPNSGSSGAFGSQKANNPPPATNKPPEGYEDDDLDALFNDLE